MEIPMDIGYSEFWSDTLQKLHEMEQTLSYELNSVEKEWEGYSRGIARLKEVVSQISSIYSHFDGIDGHEELLQLKALVERAERGEGIPDFALMNRLLLKIIDLRDISLSSFPSLPHSSKKNSTTTQIQRTTVDSHPWEWITFSRKNTRFIAPSRGGRYYSLKGYRYQIIRPGLVSLRKGNTVTLARDLLVSEEDNDSGSFLINLRGAKNYIADSVHRVIRAKKDIFSSELEPVSALGSKSYAGTLRLFGYRHIMLDV